MFLSILASSLGPAVVPVVLAFVPMHLPEVDPSTGALFTLAQDLPSEDPRTFDRKRVLELADGGFVRDRTRFAAGRWERRVGRDWVPVDGEVVGHVLESDLLSRARAMASEVGKDDHSARVVLADWMVRKGLRLEALGELDRILTAVPDHAGAVTILRERDFPLDVLAPGATIDDPTSLAIAGAQGSAAVREALVWKLARLRAQLDVQAFLTAELTTPQHRRREFAAFAARRLVRKPLQKALTDRSVLDNMGSVRTEAAFALRDLEDVQAVGPVVDALGSRFAAVRRNAAESLGNAGYAAAVAPLMTHLAHLRAAGTGTSGVRANLFVGFQTAYVGDYDVEIAQAASIADPVVGTIASGTVYDVRAQAQISRTVTLVVERRETIGALQKLTGQQELGDDPDAWLRWWEQNRERFQAERVQPTELPVQRSSPSGG
jgi:hypothetical protein